MRIRRIGILASANAQKPAIIIDKIKKYKMLEGYELFLFTVGEEGCCCDVCRQYGIEIIGLKDNKLQAQEDIQTMKAAQCDLLVSMGWPYLIPEEILGSFKKSINCHGSILPDYRGSTSYMHYYANCEENYGVSIHYMNARFDDGKVLIQSGYKALEHENHNDMHIRSAELCAFLLPAAISLVERDYEGYEPVGEKRYFFKCTHEEFMEYRACNEQRKQEGLPLILTPHKQL